jgi:hypothetical protein
MVAHVCHSSYVRKDKIRITGLSQSRIICTKSTPYLQNNKSTEGTGGMAQVVTCQPSKHEDQSSNLTITKNKNNKENHCVL